MSIWIQITSGMGPEECRRVVSRITALILSDASKASATMHVIEQVAGNAPNTYQSLVLSLESDHAPDWLYPWLGTIQWTNSSPYRPNHRRKNWFIGVYLLEQPEHHKWKISDVQIDTFRASGPGGQHVNKTESAIRATHLPTGLTAVSQDARSQYENRQLALERLKRRLQNENDETNQEAKRKLRERHGQLERGKPVKVFSGPF